MLFRIITFATLLVSLNSMHAYAAKRTALLIGNQAYAREVGPLTNPINDVNLIATTLRKIGFAEKDIYIVKDGDRRQILQAVDNYADNVNAAGRDAIGFFYYSGHGASNKRNRKNYIIPVGVGRLDNTVWYDAIPLETIIFKLSNIASNAAHFVIFDACRNVLKAPTRGAKGFVPVREERGMLIAFSTDPGETASDEGSDSGPYAAALAAELVKPGLHHLDVFQNVKEEVFRKTRVQVPWERNGLLHRVFLGGKLASKNQVPDVSAAAQDWQFVKDTNNPAALRVFAERYKGTVFADMALAMAEKTSSLLVKPPIRAPQISHAPSPRSLAQACSNRSSIQYCVSSYLPTGGVNRSDYGPKSLTDDNSKTAWVENNPNVGIGEWILIDWQTEYSVVGLRIMNGYPKTQRHYRINGRVTEFLVTLSNGKKFSLSVKDQSSLQELRFPTPQKARWLSAEITAAKRGTNYADTAINEIRPIFD